jgi:hypothetical protein
MLGSIAVFFALSQLMAYGADIQVPRGRLFYSYIKSNTDDLSFGPDTNNNWASASVYSVCASVWPKIPGAIWIWDAPIVSNSCITQECMFRKDFTITGSVQSAVLEISVDNYITTAINDNLIECVASANWYSILTCVVDTSFFKRGTNRITHNATNGGGDCYPYNNPGGLLYKLTIIELRI